MLRRILFVGFGLLSASAFADLPKETCFALSSSTGGEPMVLFFDGETANLQVYLSGNGSEGNDGQIPVMATSGKVEEGCKFKSRAYESKWCEEENKLHLNTRYNPGSNGWDVTIDFDSMKATAIRSDGRFTSPEPNQYYVRTTRDRDCY